MLYSIQNSEELKKNKTGTMCAAPRFKKRHKRHKSDDRSDSDIDKMESYHKRLHPRKFHTLVFLLSKYII